MGRVGGLVVGLGGCAPATALPHLVTLAHQRSDVRTRFLRFLRQISYLGIGLVSNYWGTLIMVMD